MSSITPFTLFAIIFTLYMFPSASTASPDFPGFPGFRNICNYVECGMGKCKSSETSTFGYECECDPGWKRSAFTNISAPKISPCVVPDCTLNYSCSETATLVPPEIGTPITNGTFFDFCSLVYCGGGVCNRKSGLSYACECKEGYTNLLNDTAFPCFKPCSFGSDCMDIIVPPPSPVSPPFPFSPPITPVGTPPPPVRVPIIDSPSITEYPPIPESPAPTLSPGQGKTVINQATSLQREAFFFGGLIVLAISIAPCP